MHVSALYSYPIKSCGGLSHDRIDIHNTGPVYDRHWLVTDTEGMFLTQRAYPQMALVQPRFDGHELVVSAPGMDGLRLPLEHPADAPRHDVVIWRDTVEAVDEGDIAAQWISEALGVSTRIVMMPPSTVRSLDPNYATRGGQVGFADGYPLLLVTQASLDDLNHRIEARGGDAVPMARFRPNVVVEEAAAWDEDHWALVRIGEMVFDGVKPCARCAITTVDQATGQIPNPKEPLGTLATFRNSDLGVLFGQNAVPRETGTLAVGDAVVPLE